MAIGHRVGLEKHEAIQGEVERAKEYIRQTIRQAEIYFGGKVTTLMPDGSFVIGPIPYRDASGKVRKKPFPVEALSEVDHKKYMYFVEEFKNLIARAGGLAPSLRAQVGPGEPDATHLVDEGAKLD